MSAKIAAVILAGGQASRFGGGDKLRIRLGQGCLLERMLALLAEITPHVALNANGDAARWAEFALPVIPDEQADFPGPLAGLLAGMDWAAGLPGVEWLLSLPGDTPFLPSDLYLRLSQAVTDGAPAAIAASGGRSHPVVGLWPVAARSQLRHLLEADERRAGFWAKQIGAVPVDWPIQPIDPFFNINTPEDLRQAEALLASLGRQRFPNDRSMRF